MRRLTLLLALFGCGETTSNTDSLADALALDAMTEADAATDGALLDAEIGDVAPPDGAVTDPTEAVFEPNHLIRVEVQIAPEDWAALRVQERAPINGPNCLDQPFPSPYTWFHADVSVDGVTYEDVGIRKKGFYGSVTERKPSVKVRFDKYQEQTHETLTRLTLNNARQDPSLLRTCLSYGLFAKLGVPAPRCNFATLTVNGEDYGVYAHVEALKRPFLARHFEDDGGLLYEGTLSDFRPPYDGTIEQKTQESSPDRTPINALISALESTDEDLIGAVGAVIDLDAYLTFWAGEIMIAHWDGYAGNTNNFWFYADPTDGKIKFIPWGPDGTFARPRLFFEGEPAPWSVFAVGHLARRLYQHPEGRRRYLERLEEMLERHWVVAELNAEVDRMVGVIAGEIPGPQAGAYFDAVQDVKDFIFNQRTLIRSEVADGPVEWDHGLRDSICVKPAGEASGTLETTWGTFPTDNAFQTGTGTFEATFRDEPWRAAQVGASAGVGDDGRATFVVPLRLGGGQVLFFYIAYDLERVATGILELDDRVTCSFNGFTGDGQIFQIAQCPYGRIDFGAVGTEDGAPVTASFRLELWASGE